MFKEWISVYRYHILIPSRKLDPHADCCSRCKIATVPYSLVCRAPAMCCRVAHLVVEAVRRPIRVGIVLVGTLALDVVLVVHVGCILPRL